MFMFITCYESHLHFVLCMNGIRRINKTINNKINSKYIGGARYRVLLNEENIKIILTQCLAYMLLMIHKSRYQARLVFVEIYEVSVV